MSDDDHMHISSKKLDRKQESLGISFNERPLYYLTYVLQVELP